MSEAVIRRCDFRIREGRKVRSCEKVVESGEPTIFAFDGEVFSADLCDECKMTAREHTTMAELIKIARPEWARVGASVRRLLRGKSGDVTTAMVREWARQNDWEVADSGKVGKEIWDAYTEAHA